MRGDPGHTPVRGRDYWTAADKAEIHGEIDAAVQTHGADENAHAELFALKVDAVDGKSLSTNDYTDADKAKLDALENYTLPAATDDALGGVMVDDAHVCTDKIWHSQQIIDALCPPFEATGNPVVCHPVAGSPLNIKARVEPNQHLDWLSREGQTTQNGTPTPDAPIPLVDSVPAGGYYVPSTAPEGGYWRIDLAEALGGIGDYGDALEIDAFTGRWRVVKKTGFTSLTGNMNNDINNAGLLQVYCGLNDCINGYSRNKCSHAKSIFDMHSDGFYTYNRMVVFGEAFCANVGISASAEAKAYLDAQIAAGTPVTIRYALATPIITTGQATHVTSTAGLTPLNAVSMRLTAPDPEHPCEITVADRVQITHNGDTYDIALPDGFDGGEVDVTDGKITKTFVRRVLRGSDYWALNGDVGFYTASSHGKLTPNTYLTMVCNHYRTATSGDRRVYAARLEPFAALYVYDSGYAGNLDAWRAYVEEQYNAGTPIVLYYEIATPTESAIAPVTIPALPGTNTITTDADALTVEGRDDPVHIIGDLTQRLAALESAATK